MFPKIAFVRVKIFLWQCLKLFFKKKHNFILPKLERRQIFFSNFQNYGMCLEQRKYDKRCFIAKGKLTFLFISQTHILCISTSFWVRNEQKNVVLSTPLSWSTCKNVSTSFWAIFTNPYQNLMYSQLSRCSTAKGGHLFWPLSFILSIHITMFVHWYNQLHFYTNLLY